MEFIAGYLFNEKIIIKLQLPPNQEKVSQIIESMPLPAEMSY